MRVMHRFFLKAFKADELQQIKLLEEVFAKKKDVHKK